MHKTKMLSYERGGLQKAYYSDSEVIMRNCPLCESQDYSHICSERGSLGVVRCRRCGLIYVNPMAKEPEKNYWGDERKYYEEARFIFEGTAKSHRDPNYLEDIKRIEKIKPEGNLLDIGTNAGFFLRHTRGRKWNVLGIEPSPTLSEMARKYFGLNVKTTYLENAGFTDEFFDIVTMADVLEHIVEPKKMLSDIRRVLKKEGILFIKVPNGTYNLLKLRLAKYFNNSLGYDIFDSCEHIVHYTHRSLRRILEDSGFEINKIFIGSPIQLPAWHKHVGRYYEYPSPWILDWKSHIVRNVFYWISKIEFLLRGCRASCFASNITVIASKVNHIKNRPNNTI